MLWVFDRVLVSVEKLIEFYFNFGHTMLDLYFSLGLRFVFWSDSSCVVGVRV